MTLATVRKPFGLDFPGDELGDWFILRTRARQEKVLTQELGARSISCFLPLVRMIRYYGGRRNAVDLPLFPGYVFLRGSRDEAFDADRTRRIAQIIKVCDQHRLDVELKSLHQALRSEAPLNPYPYLKKGVWVEVRAGPFRGIQGLIEDRSRANLLVLQVNILGRAVSLEIDCSLLDVIDSPASSAESGRLIV